MDNSRIAVTQLLVDWGNGDQAAFNALVPLVHEELRKLARSYMRRERAGHTLQTSALVNEAYLRLGKGEAGRWENRTHFFAVAAQVMRHVLIDHARSYRHQKRGGGAQRVDLDDLHGMSEERAAELIELDEALSTLAEVDPRKSRIVELRFFGGFGIEEVAEFLELSPTTVQREWRSARAWLHRFLTNSDQLSSL
jgi:RNA polymerase sigma-70 factor, ECF subfamily